MKKILLVVFVLVCGKFFPQMDTIVQKSGLKSPVKIVQMTADEVRFHVPGKDSAKVNSLKHYSIDRVIMSNGAVVYMGNLQNLSQPHKEKRVIDTTFKFAQQYFGYEFTSMVFYSVSVNYRFITKDGVMGVRLPFVFNLGPKVDMYQTDFTAPNRKFSGGVEFSFFPFLQRKVSYYVGPEFKYGAFSYSEPYYWPNPTPQPVPVIYADGVHTSFVINNGLLIRITNGFWADISAGFGIQKNARPQKYGSRVTPKGSLLFSMGYGF